MERKNRHKFCIVLEFDMIYALGASLKYAANAEELVGTTGKYYFEVEDEYSHAHINSWIRFYLRNKYLRQFYDENINKDTQLEILTGFISEVVEKCGKKREQKENCSESDLSTEIDLFMEQLHENLIKNNQEKNFSEKGAFQNFSDIFSGEFFGNRDKGK